MTTVQTLKETSAVEPSLAIPSVRPDAAIPKAAFIPAVSRIEAGRGISPVKVPRLSVSMSGGSTRISPVASAKGAAIAASLPCCVASAAFTP